MPLPCPAPAWISTWWPARVSSSTPTGIRATRDSCVLISLGTPTTSLSPFAIDVPRSRACRRPKPRRYCRAGQKAKQEQWRALRGLPHDAEQVQAELVVGEFDPARFEAGAHQQRPEVT